MSFKGLNLDPRILKAIEEAGFANPTPIQMSAIPEIMRGSDIRASAQTGTGKTAAYLFPALHRIATTQAKEGTGPRVLILVPTRELAMQVADEATKHGKHLAKCKTVCIYGGAPYPLQKRQLSRPYEILVVTPGRLIDHIDQGRVDFSRLEILILDEADRMLDMGFIDAVDKIVAMTPATRQTLLFSATLKGQVLHLSKRLMNQPQEICVIPTQENHDHIKQQVYYTDHLSHKLDLLKQLLDDSSINQAIIFTSTKRYADELANELREAGHQASALHGDMNQRQRARTLLQLREGHLRLLVATDVAARGIDVATISHVFNFDLPRCVEDYTHRIGRTGRAGASGIALSFVTPKERPLMRQIEAFIKQKITPDHDEKSEKRSEDFSDPKRSFRNYREPRRESFDSQKPAPRKFNSPSKSSYGSSQRPNSRFNQDDRGYRQGSSQGQRQEYRQGSSQGPNQGQRQGYGQGYRQESSQGQRQEYRQGSSQGQRQEYRQGSSQGPNQGRKKNFQSSYSSFPSTTKRRAKIST